MRKVSARQVFLGLLLCGAIAYLAVTIRATPRPAAGAQPRKPTPTGTQVAKAEQGPVDLKLPEEAQFSSYGGMVARDIFSPPKPPEPAAVLPTPPLPGTGPKPPDTTPKPRPPDLSGWSYVGYMVIGNQKIGMLQNEGNNSMMEAPLGEPLGAQFPGAKVQEITSDEIVISSPRGEVRLSTPRDFPVLSLSKGSAGTTSRTVRAGQQPGQPQPGPPPQPGD